MSAATQTCATHKTATDPQVNSVTSAAFPLRVPYVDLRGEYAQRREQILARIDAVCADARFILRQEVDALEARFAAFTGTQHAVAVGNGTDALLLALKALNIGAGDEVITVAHTFVASVAAIVHCGATPVLIDVQSDYTLDPAQLERALTPRSKALIPVHLNGRCCDMHTIRAILRPRGIAIVEDAAQAIGARYHGQPAGSLGDIGCFSLHPMKTLHGYGDGGMITTNDARIADTLRLLRNHGQRNKNTLEIFGYNSRLDNLQAAILLVNMDFLEQENTRRRAIAQHYHSHLSGIDGLLLPPPPVSGAHHDIYNSYVVRATHRNALHQHLTAHGIEAMRHWDPPLHQHPGLKLGHLHLPMTEQLATEVLSLPIFPGISDTQIEQVVDSIKSFFRDL